MTYLQFWKADLKKPSAVLKSKVDEAISTGELKGKKIISITYHNDGSNHVYVVVYEK